MVYNGYNKTLKNLQATVKSVTVKANENIKNISKLHKTDN